jgi:hypothetical protein
MRNKNLANGFHAPDTLHKLQQIKTEIESGRDMGNVKGRESKGHCIGADTTPARSLCKADGFE